MTDDAEMKHTIAEILEMPCFRTWGPRDTSQHLPKHLLRRGYMIVPVRDAENAYLATLGPKERMKYLFKNDYYFRYALPAIAVFCVIMLFVRS